MVNTNTIGLIDTTKTGLFEEETKTIITSPDPLGALTFAICKMDEDSVEDHSKEQTNEITRKIESLEQLIAYPEPRNEVAMKVETSDTVEDSLVPNLLSVIPHPEGQMEAFCHDEKEKLLDPVVNNLEVAEPCVEVISQKEIIETNEVAMSVDIASDFDQNQVSKSKFPEDTSENMDIWNESQDTSVSGENIDQNFTMEFQDGQKDYRKDNFSFSFKNALVLMRYDEKASSKQREEFFKTMFPYYCTAPAGWEKSARHNLSETNGYFEKTNEAAPTIKGQRGPKGKLWTFSESKKEKLKKAMIKEWKAFGEDIKSTSACPTLVATLFKKILDSIFFFLFGLSNTLRITFFFSCFQFLYVLCVIH